MKLQVDCLDEKFITELGIVPKSHLGSKHVLWHFHLIIGIIERWEITIEIVNSQEQHYISIN